MSKQVEVIKDAVILIPNKTHENFTATDDIIPQGEQLKGIEKLIEGKRRGKPFTYKLFITENDEIIYNKNVKPMQTTEVKLGLSGVQEEIRTSTVKEDNADGAVTPAVINMTPPEIFSKTKTVGLVLGGLAAYGYCKYKKCDAKKTAMYIGVGALAGWLTGFYADTNRVATALPSK